MCRRIVAVALCITLFVLSLALVGCGGKNDPKTAKAAGTTNKTSTKKVIYPNPIVFTGPVNDGYGKPAGTPIKLTGTMKPGAKKRLDNLRVAAIGKKSKISDINSNRSRYGNDTQLALIDGRYYVHIDGLSEGGGSYFGTVWDLGPNGGKKYKPKTLKVPFGVDFRIPRTDLTVHSELNGAWRYYDLFASVDGTMSRNIDLNNYRSDPISDSRLRLVDDRYLLHVEGLSKQPRKYFVLGVIDLKNRYEHKYVTVWKDKPTKIEVFGSKAVVTFRLKKLPKNSYDEQLLAELPDGRQVNINGWEPTPLDTVKVTEASYNPNGWEKARVLDITRLE